MNELRRLIALNARWYGFLAQQDDATLATIIDGNARVAVVHDQRTPVEHRTDNEARVDPSPATATPPALDPWHVARELGTLTSKADRRDHLIRTGLSVRELCKVAKALGLTRYSRLTRDALLDLLARSGPAEGDEPAAVVETTAQATHPPGEPDRQIGAQELRPPVSTPPDATARPTFDAAAVAERLRGTDTEQEGAAHLDALGLDKEELLAVAAELRLTRVGRLTRMELRRRVLKQAIGARRKFAGLRKW